MRPFRLSPSPSHTSPSLPNRRGCPCHRQPRFDSGVITGTLVFLTDSLLTGSLSISGFDRTDSIIGCFVAARPVRGVSLAPEPASDATPYQRFGYPVLGHARVEEGLETWGMFRALPQ